MSRRCSGDEPGLCCCLSLRPARCLAALHTLACADQHSAFVSEILSWKRGGLSDSTLDPGKALATGHFFADRGAPDGILHAFVCIEPEAAKGFPLFSPRVMSKSDFPGPVTWDGDCPTPLLEAGAEVPESKGKYVGGAG